MIPPTPPRTSADGASTVAAGDEIYAGDAQNPLGPYGLGVRVPMIVVSPWSKGGWVCSEVFDHTSLIRFLERRFARHTPDLIEANITDWRRAICGDLTSAFDFDDSNTTKTSLPSTAAYVPQNHDRHPDYVPTPPTDQKMPRQQRGLRRARALPYELTVEERTDAGSGTVRLDFVNRGKAGACFHVRSALGATGPWSFTVEAKKSLSNLWSLASTQGAYDLSVHGPNGFFRRFRGGLSRNSATDLDVDVRVDADDGVVVLRVANQRRDASRIRITNAYGDGGTLVEVLPRGRTLEKRWPLPSTFGWYDIAVRADADPGFLRQAAGHVENGRDSVSDPAFGNPD